MIKRPRVGETEDDLLKQQAEFLKGKETDASNELKDPPKVQNHEQESFNIVGDVVERHNRSFASNNLKNVAKVGFPSVFEVSTEAQPSKNYKKKSLFAQQFKEKHQEKESEKMEVDIVENALLTEIDQENRKKMETMSTEQILEQKKALETMLDSDMLNFLKKRGSNKKKVEEGEPSTIKAETPINISEVKENLTKIVDEKWMDMDTIEPEKLQWIGDIPDASALQPDQPYSARFDFSGDLQPFKTEIDVRTSLHHHGDEPERPGYTIQELYQLSRSTVLQQRILALNTLANITRKTKMGYYDSCFDGALLKKLVESDVFFLLRFAMDDRTTFAGAVNCLYELFVSRSDELCLDLVQTFPGENEEPFLFVPIETDQDTEENELKDHELIAQDLVRGVLRTDLLIRFSYILSSFEPDEVTVSKIFEVVIRVCRHSPESCQQVFDSDFMPLVFADIHSRLPHRESVKLVRVMTSSSRTLALAISSKLDFKTILNVIEMDEPAFKLKLECLALWRTFLKRGIFFDEIQGFTPCLLRLLFFYAAKVDVSHGRFDFELFAALVSTVNIVQKQKQPLDAGYLAVLQICLEKWIVQLTANNRCNFSVAKAIGNALTFFVFKYENGVENADLEFIRKMLPVLTSFLSSRCFVDICTNMINYSHIVQNKTADRDPINLPSLGTVYKNGSDYLKIVHEESMLPFIESLSEFLLRLSNISVDFTNLLSVFSQNLKKYEDKISLSSESTSWFSRYEIGVFISLTRVRKKCCDPNTLELCFKIVPHLRIDDKRILQIIEVLSSFDHLESFWDAFRTHVHRRFKDLYYHSSENFPKHWMYEPIAAAPQQTLTFLTNILEKKPNLLSYVPPTLRFCHLCLVLLDNEAVFNDQIHSNLEKCFEDIILQFDELDLSSISISDKTFYELYRDLVVEYASSSYGDLLFAKAVTLPLAQKFDISYRKLMWSEYMHALRVITLPKDVSAFVSLETFASPTETDESLLVLYLNAFSKNVINNTRNGFLYAVAMENIKKFLALPEKDEKLAGFLRKRIDELLDEELKRNLMP